MTTTPDPRIVAGIRWLEGHAEVAALAYYVSVSPGYVGLSAYGPQAVPIAAALGATSPWTPLYEGAAYVETGVVDGDVTVAVYALAAELSPRLEVVA